MCPLLARMRLFTYVVSVDGHHSFNSPPSVIMAEALELPVERAVFTEYSFFLLIIYHTRKPYICIPSPVFLFGGEMLI